MENLHNGVPVEKPWIGKVKAVLETYLGGQAVGGAVVNVLYGNTNPSGHLAETFPLRLQDTPCYLNYGGEHDRSVYSEGIFVGYRYYASKDIEVLFPFGHGLSYTTFAYRNLSVNKEQMAESETLTVTRRCDEHRRNGRKRSRTALCGAKGQYDHPSGKGAESF